MALALLPNRMQMVPSSSARQAASSPAATPPATAFSPPASQASTPASKAQGSLVIWDARKKPRRVAPMPAAMGRPLI